MTDTFISVPSSIFWKRVCRTDITYSFKKFGKIINKATWGPGVFFVARFLSTNSISLIDIGLVRFWVSSEVSCGSLSRECFI